MWRHYFKIAWKVLLRRKFFSMINVFAIGFTLMVLMTVTALLDHILRAGTLEAHSNRTLLIDQISLHGKNHGRYDNPGYYFLDRYTRGLPSVEKESFFSTTSTVYAYPKGEKIGFSLKRTDGTFWQILNFRFLEGAAFVEEDNRLARPVAIINEAVRQQLFDGGSALGKSLEVDGQSFQIVGVVENVPFFRQIPFSDIWIPIHTNKSKAYQEKLLGGFRGIYLARSQRDFPVIQAKLQSRLLNAEIPDPGKFQEWKAIMITPVENICFWLYPRQWGEPSMSKVLTLLLLSTILFMLLPTINLINLNVSRILERAPEIGVRKAFGASSWQLIGQFVAENVLLTSLGCGFGYAGSMLLLKAISHSGWVPYARFGPTLSGFFYGLLLTLFFGLFTGIYPAWHMSRLQPVEALRGVV